MERNEQTSAQSEEEWRRAVDRRLAAGDRRFRRIERAIEHNTDLTKEIRDLLELGRSCFRFFKNCGRLIAWLRPVILGAAALWGLVFGHHGRPPDPPAH